MADISILANMSKTDGYREYEVTVGCHKYCVVVDTGAWLNYMVASIFEQVKSNSPECILTCCRWAVAVSVIDEGGSWLWSWAACGRAFCITNRVYRE